MTTEDSKNRQGINDTLLTEKQMEFHRFPDPDAFYLISFDVVHFQTFVWSLLEPVYVFHTCNILRQSTPQFYYLHENSLSFVGF